MSLVYYFLLGHSVFSFKIVLLVVFFVFVCYTHFAY